MKRLLPGYEGYRLWQVLIRHRIRNTKTADAIRQLDAEWRWRRDNVGFRRFDDGGLEEFYLKMMLSKEWLEIQAKLAKSTD